MSYEEILNDLNYIILLKGYISEALDISEINHNSITNLKKIITNIDVIL